MIQTEVFYTKYSAVWKETFVVSCQFSSVVVSASWFLLLGSLSSPRLVCEGQSTLAITNG